MLFGLPPAVFSQNSQNVPEKKRPRIGLVLEGGGALGFAHIGVLQWLEDHHIPIDYVAGTSMGGLVGGLYATGRSPHELGELVEHGIDWVEVLNGEVDYPMLSYRRKEDQDASQNNVEIGLKHGISLPGGINLGHQVGLVLDRATLPYGDLKSFDDLPIPFRCVATDLTVGEKRVFSDGILSDALRATMSLPGIFAPAVVNGHQYSDGGVLDNLPVDVAKDMGAEIIIAVYLDTGPEPPATSLSLLDVAGRNVAVVIKANELHSMKTADILITVPLAGYTSSDFEKANEIAPKGGPAANEKKAMLERLAVSDGEWQQYLAARNARKRVDLPMPTFVHVTGASDKLDSGVNAYLNSLANKPVDPDNIENQLDLVKGTGRFENLRYALVTENGKTGLMIRAAEKPYAPPFLNFSVNVDGADPADVRFGFTARITTMVGANPRTEWRTNVAFGNLYGVTSELYHPLTVKSKFFYDPHAFVLRGPFDVYDNGQRVAEYNISKAGAGLDLGYAISRFAEFRVGEDFAYYWAKKKIGTSEFPNTTFYAGVTKAQFNYLGHDDAVIPHKGFANQTLAQYFTNGSAGKPFPLAQTYNSYFYELNPKGSIFVVADGGTSFGHHNLDLNSFTLGGPLRLGAYGRNELVGTQFYLFQAGYLRQIEKINPLIGDAIYASVFYEVGKVYDSGIQTGNLPMDGSVVLIVKTSIGPAFIGGSIGDNGRAKWWFGIGRIF